jgi:uncharacterized integral membrane protein (TIGR00698 family)
LSTTGVSPQIPGKPKFMENLLFGCRLADLPRLIPGVVLSALLVVLSIFLTDAVNALLGFSGLISYILTVILLGIAVRNTVGVPALFLPGINFCLRKLLRLGIILMGIKLSVFDVLKIGAWGIPIIAFCVVAGLVITDYFARWLKVPERLAILIAVGTSICGASAIVATAPGIEARDEEVTYAVANITIFGLIALVLYRTGSSGATWSWLVFSPAPPSTKPPRSPPPALFTTRLSPRRPLFPLPTSLP